MTSDAHPTSTHHRHDAIDGKVAYLLLVVIFLQTAYPLTTAFDSHPAALIGFQLCYLLMMVGSIVMAQGHRRLQAALIVVGIAWVMAGAFYAFNIDSQQAILVTYCTLSVFQVMVIYVLMHYIFGARTVTRDVLFAACTVYLLLGAIFVPVYGVIETVSWFSAEPTHAFIDNSLSNPDQPIQWQTFVYYSYSTLTTLGYGDVLPVSGWARSAATIEAVVGVLYLAILMARLVGVYAATEVEEELDDQHHNASD